MIRGKLQRDVYIDKESEHRTTYRERGSIIMLHFSPQIISANIVINNAEAIDDSYDGALEILDKYDADNGRTV